MDGFAELKSLTESSVAVAAEAAFLLLLCVLGMIGAILLEIVESQTLCKFF